MSSAERLGGGRDVGVRPPRTARRTTAEAPRARLHAWLSVAALMGAAGLAHAAALDLSELEVLPQHGQSAEQARRDRYECHNWAVDQTGVVPSTVPGDERARAARAQRIHRIISGAAIGAGVGGFIRGRRHHDAGDGALAGAAVGAAVGAAMGGRRDQAELDPGSSEYLRALSACLEGRGYAVARSGTATHRMRQGMGIVPDDSGRERPAAS